MKELYGSRFVFEIKSNEDYQIYLAGKKLEMDEAVEAVNLDKSNLSEEEYLATERDMVYPLVNAENEAEGAFRRINTSFNDDKSLLDRFKEQKTTGKSKVIDIVKNDIQIMMSKMKRSARRKSGMESSFDEYHPQATCEISKDCVAPPFGFRNYGANCYANATLQCLLCIPEMNTYFLERQYRSSSVYSSRSSFPICDSIADLYDEGFKEEGPAWVAPKSLMKICPQGQQDAHEFLWKRLVQNVQNETNAPKKKPRRENLDGKQSWEWYKRNHHSIFEILFGGLYESQVECKVCGYRSLTYDPFLDISLPIVRKALVGCLHSYFGIEELSKKDLYRCSKCKKPVPAVKRLSIFKPPKYLLLNLKRLVGTSKKIGDFIQYPNTLDIGSFCASEEYMSKYKLIALCVHNGGSTSGHYYAYGKRGNKVTISPNSSGTSLTTK